MSEEQQKSSGQDVQRETKELNPLYVLQLRAFLSAAEDVDADPDTIEDLLEGLSDDVCGEMTKYDSDIEGSETEELSEPIHEISTPKEVDDTEVSEDGDASSDIQALEEEAEQAWTKSEVRKMMHHLKERGMSSFIKEYVVVQNVPIIKLLLAFGINLCPELRNKRAKTLLYILRVAMSRELHLREKLPQYNTILDAVSLISNAERIVVLTGAGISCAYFIQEILASKVSILGVSCGIPDFRSRNGLYATFDIRYFRENPAGKAFTASQIYPSNFIPSPCHRFIKVIEDKRKLLRNYTQNIDTLETQAGITRVLQCHGSFKTATCLQCQTKVPGAAIEREILEQRIPYCKACYEVHKASESQKNKPPKKKGKKKKNEWEEDSDESDELPVGVMKPDITFFGEKLTNDFDQALIDDREKVDLLLVIGTSLKVSPVSEILSHLPHSVPQILINKTPIRHINPDIVLLGNADDIVQHLCEHLKWDLPPPSQKKGSPQSSLTEGMNGKRTSSEMTGRAEPVRVGDSHVWLFDGAEGGKWVQDIEEKYDTGATMNGTADHSEERRQAPRAKKARVS
ncbi:hypothetical protein HYDPIDRAFT_88766 [Hydnomerulius pinastri MD-312]|uniref:Deacetylase sirtuin-type domain-containing protein n=1 Tax=Hydnomerulius pinastri MD-312 TaxID=994086 RepID=A0A0C9WFW5_9AGAM|nr:hypothetical protein HYDPIDRAFT_88766 [Hydnomerulius pinastri MD-312]